MQLTSILLKKLPPSMKRGVGPHTNIPHGFEYRGKHRRLRPISLLNMWNLRREFEITERNMLILRHPYLTVEQSKGHTIHLRQQKIDEFYANIHKPKNDTFAKKGTTLAEKFNKLRVTEGWD